MMSLKAKDPSTRIASGASMMSDASLDNHNQRISTTSSFPGFYPIYGERLPSIHSRYSSVSRFLEANMQGKENEAGRVDSSQSKGSRVDSCASRTSSWDSSKRVGSVVSFLNTARADSIETIMNKLPEASLPPPLKGISSGVLPAASRDSITNTAVDQRMSTGELFDIFLGDDQWPREEPAPPIDQTKPQDDTNDSKDVKEEPKTNEVEPTEDNEEPQDKEMVVNETPPDDEGGYITFSYTELDILSGRGGLGNRHPGNIRYRSIIEESKKVYQQDITDKRAKTAFSHKIVAYIHGYGGRFLEKQDSGGWYVKTKNEARRKTSQCLRETKTLKWTSLKKVQK